MNSKYILKDDNYLNFIQENNDLFDCCTSSNTDDSVMRFIPTFNKSRLFELSSKYPQIEYKGIKDGLKNKFGIEKMILGCGSEDLILRLNTYINSTHSKVLVVRPTFYRISKTLDKYKTAEYHDLKDLALDRFDFVWITNPNVINGEIYPMKELIELINTNKDTVFLVDEASVLFLGEPRRYSLLPHTKSYTNLVVISSFSKFYGLSGIRFGFLSGSCQVVDHLLKQSPTFSVDNITQDIVLNLLKNPEVDEIIRSNISVNQKKVVNLFRNFNNDVKIKTSALNFVFLKSEGGNIYSDLLKNGIATFNLSLHDKGMDGWVRMTIHGSKKLNKALITKLNKYLKDGRNERKQLSNKY